MLLTSVETRHLQAARALLEELPHKQVRPVIEHIDYCLSHYTWEDEQEQSEQQRTVGFQTTNEVDIPVEDNEDI